jgi:MFS family permease
MVEDLKSTASFLGIGFTISSIIQGLLLLKAGSLSDKNGRRYSAVIGTSLISLSLLVLVATIHPWMFLLSMAISGLGAAFLSTTPSAIVGDVMKGKGGQVIAVFQMSGDAGAMIAPVVLGFVADHYGFRPAFVVCAGLMFIALVVATKLPETRPSHLGQSS